ncbi:hypothetical protein MIMGU_mgv1a022517mg, partial [Erythranthe guttata]
ILLSNKIGFLPTGLMAMHNLKDPAVVSIAKFAVTEYNKNEDAPLKFITIIKGKQHTVSRSGYRSDLYHLIISVKDNTIVGPQRYEIVVIDQPWVKKQPIKLESFKQFPYFILE